MMYEKHCVSECFKLNCQFPLLPLRTLGFFITVVSGVWLWSATSFLTTQQLKSKNLSKNLELIQPPTNSLDLFTVFDSVSPTVCQTFDPSTVIYLITFGLSPITAHKVTANWGKSAGTSFSSASETDGRVIFLKPSQTYNVLPPTSDLSSWLTNCHQRTSRFHLTDGRTDGRTEYFLFEVPPGS